MTTLVEIREASKTYERGKQKVEVLHHIDLDIAKGDFLALMGPSGSGKTTLLNLIGGLDSPSGGSISVGGQRIDKLGGGALAKWRAANVGFIFQFYNLLPMLSAFVSARRPNRVRPSLLFKVKLMSDHVVPHFHNDAGVPVIEIGSREFMCVGAQPPFDHPHEIGRAHV